MAVTVYSASTPIGPSTVLNGVPGDVNVLTANNNGDEINGDYNVETLHYPSASSATSYKQTLYASELYFDNANQALIGDAVTQNISLGSNITFTFTAGTAGAGYAAGNILQPLAGTATTDNSYGYFSGGVDDTELAPDDSVSAVSNATFNITAKGNQILASSDSYDYANGYGLMFNYNSSNSSDSNIALNVTLGASILKLGDYANAEGDVQGLSLNPTGSGFDSHFTMSANNITAGIDGFLAGDIFYATVGTQSENINIANSTIDFSTGHNSITAGVGSFVAGDIREFDQAITGSGNIISDVVGGNVIHGGSVLLGDSDSFYLVFNGNNDTATLTAAANKLYPTGATPESSTLLVEGNGQDNVAVFTLNGNADSYAFSSGANVIDASGESVASVNSNGSLMGNMQFLPLDITSGSNDSFTFDFAANTITGSGNNTLIVGNVAALSLAIDSSGTGDSILINQGFNQSTGKEGVNQITPGAGSDSIFTNDKSIVTTLSAASDGDKVTVDFANTTVNAGSGQDVISLYAANINTTENGLNQTVTYNLPGNTIHLGNNAAGDIVHFPSISNSTADTSDSINFNVTGVTNIYDGTTKDTFYFPSEAVVGTVDIHNALAGGAELDFGTSNYAVASDGHGDSVVTFAGDAVDKIVLLGVPVADVIHGGNYVTVT